MTAEVAVMNSQGIAIAADSAVTINLREGKKGKIYYTQEKIFNLSPKHHVGIMVYNNANFMFGGISWEIIIKEFSKKIGDNVFDKLEEYVKKFIIFLQDFNIPDHIQKNYLESICYSFFDTVKDRYQEYISKNKIDNEITKDRQNEILAEVLKEITKEIDNETYSTGFVDDGFVKANLEIVDKEFEDMFVDFTIEHKIKEEMIELFLLDLKKVKIAWRWKNMYSGIIFAGYGNNEIFPSVFGIDIHGKLGKNVLHDDIDMVSIEDSMTGWIIPFAQPNTINSFIYGIDSSLEKFISEELDKLVNGIIDITGKKHTDEIISLKDEMSKKIIDYQEKELKDSVMDMVISLPKTELAEMAEALINLTALKQHVSTEEETVGGPTDVALITKTDGFVWIKRKQLFKEYKDNIN